MFLNGENVDDMFLAVENNLLKFMPDTLIVLTDCVYQGSKLCLTSLQILRDSTVP